MPVLSQDMDLQHNMSWSCSYSVSLLRKRGNSLFCWYWWNWLLSLFKRSFHNIRTAILLNDCSLKMCNAGIKLIVDIYMLWPVSLLRKRGGCFFCWYWWNWLLSLFKRSFHNIRTAILLNDCSLKMCNAGKNIYSLTSICYDQWVY